MKINCTIDGKNEILIVEPTTPLSEILMGKVNFFCVSNKCHGARCGNCVVNINNVAVLSCLVPAFSLEGANIVTFEGYEKTRLSHDLRDAYERKNIKPCPRCYASKTLILESILNKLMYENAHKIGNSADSYKDFNLDKNFVCRELNLNSCTCVDGSELIGVLEIAYMLRSKRSVQR